LFATACGFTPQSPPETKWNESVAFAGMVRNRYAGDTRPIRNWYSVPGVRPVSSARYTFRSVGGKGFDWVRTTAHAGGATHSLFPGAANDTSLFDASQPAPTHWTVMVVVGSRCQVRKIVSGANESGPALGWSSGGCWPRRTGPAASDAARPPSEVVRKPRRF